MTRKKKGVFWLAGVLLVLCAAGALLYLLRVFQYQKTVQEFTFSSAAVDGAADGTYFGECNVGFIAAKVAVTVKDGAITQIALLEHKNDRGAPAEKIIDDMIERQKIDVDTVSGATNSSKVIKKAVENALLQAGADELAFIRQRAAARQSF